MVLRTPLERRCDIYSEYPRRFWILILGLFIDRLGGALMFPFFTLYVTRKFGLGMTAVGVLFGLFSIASVVGGVFGAALTDCLGRKGGRLADDLEGFDLQELGELIASSAASKRVGTMDTEDDERLEICVEG